MSTNHQEQKHTVSFTVKATQFIDQASLEPVLAIDEQSTTKPEDLSQEEARVQAQQAEANHLFREKEELDAQIRILQGELDDPPS